MQGNQELDLSASHHYFLYCHNLNDVLADHLSDNKMSNLVACTPHVHFVCQGVPRLQNVCLDWTIRVC